MPFVLFNWVEKYHGEIGAFYIRSGLRPATLLKKKLWHRCFPVIFVKFLRTPFYRTPLGDCFFPVQHQI